MHYIRQISRILTAFTVSPAICYNYQGPCYSKTIDGKIGNEETVKAHLLMTLSKLHQEQGYRQNTKS